MTHLHDDPDDAQLDDEIEAALSADHSPEFLARVRARVAAETTAPGAANWRRWALGAGTAPALVALLLIVRWPADFTGHPVPVPVLPSRTTVVVPALAPTVAPASLAAAESMTVSPPPRPRDARPTPGAAPADRRPEVVVSTGDAAAFDLLLVRLRQGVITAADVPSDVPHAVRDVPAAVPDPIYIEPIAIEPLILAEGAIP